MDLKKFIKETRKVLEGIPRVIQAIYEKQFAPTHIKEQVILRTFQAKDCVINGNCSACGCSMGGFADKRYAFVACDKFYECKSDYCYGEFLSKEKWKDYKKNLIWEVFIEQAEVINRQAKLKRYLGYSKLSFTKKILFKTNELFN